MTVTVEGDQRPLPAEADHSAHRILQESLTNVLRHAGPGTAVHVCLCYQPDGLAITVTDDGPVLEGEPSVNGEFRGMVYPAGDPAVLPDGDRAVLSAGHGIDGMRERATSVGGELSAGPLPGGGFQVRALLPVSGVPAVPEGGDDS